MPDPMSHSLLEEEPGFEFTSSDSKCHVLSTLPQQSPNVPVGDV